MLDAQEALAAIEVWHAVLCEWRREFFAQGQVRARGFVVYLPTRTEMVLNHHRPGWRQGPAKVQKPTYPGYLFVGASDDWRALNRVPGVAAVLASGEYPLPIRRQNLAHALDLEVESAGRPVAYAYQAGHTYKVAVGPWAEFEGLYLGHDEHGVTLDLDIFGRRVPITVPHAQIRRD